MGQINIELFDSLRSELSNLFPTTRSGLLEDSIEAIPTRNASEPLRWGNPYDGVRPKF
jgi:hypothetical protein